MYTSSIPPNVRRSRSSPAIRSISSATRRSGSSSRLSSSRAAQKRQSKSRWSASCSNFSVFVSSTSASGPQQEGKRNASFYFGDGRDGLRRRVRPRGGTRDVHFDQRPAQRR